MLPCCHPHSLPPYGIFCLQAGEEVQDPNDSCTTISCTVGADGNVTRREKETTCDSNCDLGYIYKPPAFGRYVRVSIPCLLNSQDCCGHCVKTHCVDNGNVYSLGERWESEGDACYEYSCDLRNDLPTILAVKKECPFFDPECPSFLNNRETGQVRLHLLLLQTVQV